ncbi:MAG: hypothetical protein ACFE9L_12545 [Candidatus Hodarchaeota archaeon]
MLQMLQKGNIPLSSCLISTFDQAEKLIKRQGYRFYHEYSIHAPLRLERDIQNNQLAYNFKALIYDVVTKTEEGAKSRLIITIYVKDKTHRMQQSVELQDYLLAGS